MAPASLASRRLASQHSLTERERVPRDPRVEDQGETVLRDGGQVNQAVEALGPDRRSAASHVGSGELRRDRLSVEEDLDVTGLVRGAQDEEDAACVELHVDLGAGARGGVLVGDAPVAGVGELTGRERAGGGPEVLVSGMYRRDPALGAGGAEVRLRGDVARGGRLGAGPRARSEA